MPRSEFQYWGVADSVDQWITAVTPRGGNALVNLHYASKIGSAAVVEVTLSNRSASDSFAAGHLTPKLTDFQKVRVIDGNTKMVTFLGRLFDIDQNYDLQYGPTLLLTCRDALFELQDMEMTDRTQPSIPFGASETITKRSGLIAAIVERFSKDNISTSDSDKFEDSTIPFVVTNAEYHLAGGKKSALKAIVEIASSDPMNGTGSGASGNDSTQFGHDLYVEPRFTDVNPNAVTGADTSTGQFTEEGTSDLNYFKRGSRTDPPADVGLIAKFAVRGGVAATNRTRNMLPGYDFDQPQQELFTDVNGYFTYDNRKAVARKFELWSVGSPTAAAASWTGAKATAEFL